MTQQKLERELKTATRTLGLLRAAADNKENGSAAAEAAGGPTPRPPPPEAPRQAPGGRSRSGASTART